MRSLKKILIVVGVITLIALACFFGYIYALGSMWTLNKPDKRPFFVTTKPITVKNILLPVATKITYEKQYFWETYEQEKLLNEKHITEIAFKEGSSINWGGIPITTIVKFYNSETKGFSLYGDPHKPLQETPFSSLFENCNKDLGVLVENTNDWSFNKKNILDIESCGVIYQRYFKDDPNKQEYLDNLYNKLMLIED